MNGMGRHSTPLDGVTLANGHAPALVPFAISPQIQVRQGGPVAPWPQPGKWQHAMAAARQIAAHRGWLAAIPVVLVNAVAFYGQLAFLRHHLVAPSGIQALVAVALESIAVYLAWQAHLAQLADDSAMRLRLAAYGMAALIGTMNYSHYAAAHWRPTFAAIAFALCSAISPWLWSIHSRRESRDALKAKGLIEPHAVRLGVTRWLWHPWRSPQVMWHATWHGVTDPAEAIALIAKPASAAPPDLAIEAAAEDAPGTAKTEPETSPSAAADTPVPIAKPAARRTAKRKAGKPAAGPTALAKALATIEAKPGLTDAEVAREAKVSPRTVQRARTVTGAKP